MIQPSLLDDRNERMRTINCFDANEKDDVMQKRKFSYRVMAWLGAFSKGITPLVILDEGTVDDICCIKNVLPVVLKYGNQVFGDHWIFQQYGANSH